MSTCGTTTKIVSFKKLKLIKSDRFFSTLSYIHNVGTEPLKPLTTGRLLDETVKKYGDVDAVVSSHQKKKLSFHQMLDQADKLAAGLRKIGLTPGDRVGIWAPNLLEWYVSYMACARTGLASVTINPAYQPREIEYCINKVGIKSIICTHNFKKQNFYEILNAVLPGLDKSEPGKLQCQKIPSLQSIIMLSDDNLPNNLIIGPSKFNYKMGCFENFRGTFNYEEILELPSEKEIKAVKDYQSFIKIDDPSNIQFTSGTTGHPKAAVVSHFQLVNNGFYVGKRNELNMKQHRICVQVPLFHAFGTVITIMAALNHGATLVLPSPSFEPLKSLEAINTENCTVIHGTPTMYVDLVRTQKEKQEQVSAEIAVSGGANCSPQLFKDMLEVLKVNKVKSVYGLTETTAVVFQSQHDDDETKSTSTVGYVSEHTEAKVVDQNGHIVPRGTPGELLLRGYFNMLGYWQDPDKTRETIGADRWLRTGDKFVLQEDGYGQVIGRLKEMIIRGGENIFPREIEDFLNTHPDIDETHVVGIPNERLGEEVCACIRVKEGSIITHEDIKVFCKGNIAHFKIPSVVKIVDTFPKTGSGKIQKFKLIEIVLNGSS